MLRNGAAATLEFTDFKVVHGGVFDAFPVESFVSKEQRIFCGHYRMAKVGRDTRKRDPHPLPFAGTPLLLCLSLPSFHQGGGCWVGSCESLHIGQAYEPAQHQNTQWKSNEEGAPEQDAPDFAATG